MVNTKSVLQIYKQLMLLVIVTALSKCEEENLEILYLGPLDWLDKSFLDFGSPIIRAKDKFFTLNETFEFRHKYSAIMTNLQMEGNFYLFLQDFNNATLHLYGTRHPYDVNYLINSLNSSIEKCNTECTQGKQLQTCINDSIPNHQEADDIVYVAWEIKNETIQVLMQFKNQLLKCSDSNNVIDIKKVVMSSNNDQNVSVKEQEKFAYTTKEQKKTMLSENFSLFNKSLYLQISQCQNCKALLELECGEYAYNNSVFFNETEKDILNSSTIPYLWKEVSLQGPKSGNDSCMLTISTEASSDVKTESFWAISQRVYKLYDAANNKMDANVNNNLGFVHTACNPLIFIGVIGFFFVRLNTAID